MDLTTFSLELKTKNKETAIPSSTKNSKAERPKKNIGYSHITNLQPTSRKLKTTKNRNTTTSDEHESISGPK